MKIRTGFVSNSSTSSFCICYDGSIYELAQEMILSRGWDDDDVLFDILEKSKQNIINGISFPTCNFPTYIRKFEANKFVIQTCNNHSWYELDWKTVNWQRWPLDLLEEFRLLRPQEKIELCDLSELSEFYLSRVGHYWYPEYNLFGKEPAYRAYRVILNCAHRVDEIQLDNGEVICPLCWKEKI